MFRLKMRLYGSDVREIALESGREYTFGRGEDCDIRLEKQPGISRSHFRIYEADGKWIAQVMSKFGDLVHAGQPVQALEIENGTVFKVAGYDFLFDDVARDQFEMGSAEPVSENLPMAAGDSLGQNGFQSHADENFEGNDEATRIAVSQPGVPYLRVVEPNGRENTLKLDGKKWLAGREDTNQIVLNDRKASRRQFELMNSPQGTFIRDLGSSNGTLLNGMPLAADELKPIRSGDVIQVGSLTVHFEVRDPNFEKKLQVVPPEVMAASYPVANAPAAYEIINFPVPTGPGGAVRIDGSQSSSNAWGGKTSGSKEDEKKKKMRFYLIFAIVALPVLALLSQTQEEAPKPKVETPIQDAFGRLSPQKQQQVKEIYISAKNFYMQGKHTLAGDQLKKLHEIIPEGYENSLSMAEECQAIAIQEENQRIAQLELKAAEENRRIVDANIKKCEGVANSSYSLDELKMCLAPTFERNPEHPMISDYLARVQARVSERELKVSQQRNYASRAARGRALFEKAVKIERKGDVFGAVEAYRKHIASNYPDPDGLKGRSRKSLDTILSDVESKINASMSAARSAYSAKNYREAIDNIYKVKSLDPKNNDAAMLNAQIRRELEPQLREFYEEAIISEGLGQIDFAKEKCKKIMEMDHPDGNYYKKAKSMLRKYNGL